MLINFQVTNTQFYIYSISLAHAYVAGKVKEREKKH